MPKFHYFLNWIVFHCMWIPHLFHLLLGWWTCEVSLLFSYEDNDSTNMGVQVFVWAPTFFIVGTYLSTELLDYIAILSKISWEITKLLLISTLFYSSISNTRILTMPAVRHIFSPFSYFLSCHCFIIIPYFLRKFYMIPQSLVLYLTSVVYGL